VRTMFALAAGELSGADFVAWLRPRLMLALGRAPGSSTLAWLAPEIGVSCPMCGSVAS